MSIRIDATNRRYVYNSKSNQANSLTGGCLFPGQAIFEDMGERKLAQRNIGYCPQYDDALVDLLTFAEHLDLFCSMKGFVATTEEIDNLNTVTVWSLMINYGSSFAIF